jgi:hypothetical protein
MRIALLLGLSAAAILPACGSRERTARETGAVDTVVTQRQTQDTAVVTHDTTVKVDVDTNVEHGGRATGVDTVKKSRDALQKDTGTAR